MRTVLDGFMSSERRNLRKMPPGARPTLEAETGRSLLDRVSFRTDRATQRKSVLKHKQNKRRKKSTVIAGGRPSCKAFS